MCINIQSLCVRRIITEVSRFFYPYRKGDIEYMGRISIYTNKHNNIEYKDQPGGGINENHIL